MSSYSTVNVEVFASSGGSSKPCSTHPHLVPPLELPHWIVCLLDLEESLEDPKPPVKRSYRW